MRRLSSVCWAITCLLFLTAANASGAIKTIHLDADGRIVGTAPDISNGDAVRICISGGAAKKLEVRYRETAVFQNPTLLDSTSPEVKLLKYCDPLDPSRSGAGVEDIQVTGPGFILYNVTGPALRPAAAGPVRQARAERLAAANDDLVAQKAAMETAQAVIAALTEEIKQLGTAGSAEATQAIVERQRQVAAQRPVQKAAADKVTALTSEIDGLLKETALDATPPTRAIYRLGGVVVGDSRKQVFYRLVRDGTAQQPLRLELAAGYPVLMRGDELFAVVVNVQPSAAPSQFRLTFTSEIAKPLDPAPVRPTVDQSKLGAGPARDYTAEEEMATAHADYIMTFGRPLKANELIKTTITAYSSNITSDKSTVTDGTAKHEVVTEVTNVKLIDAVEYPQVHDVYHYNITTGVVSSALRDPVFTKVKSAVGAEESDTRYRVDRNEGNRRVFPVLLFSFYWTPKDIQKPWSGRDLIPAPTVGFSLASPADNFFVGFQSEIRRNVQLVYGLHYGRVTDLGPAPIDEDRSSAAVNTRKVFDRDGFIGLSFNINFVKDLFK